MLQIPIFDKKMNPEILLLSPLFFLLEGEELESILDKVPKRTRKYKSGTVIAYSGDIVTDFLIVTEGVVKGEMVDYAGRIIKIEEIPLLQHLFLEIRTGFL